MRLAIDEHMQHKDVYTHSLVVLEQAIARETDGPDLVLRLAALLHDIGKPDTRRREPDGRVSFHHHEAVGAKLVRKRLRALRYPKVIVDEVAQLVFLHLRFHGYGGGEWTDSAVRRYVTDAGPLLDRLHKLVRSDCTTRNKRRAAALQRTYDDLESRITALRAQEELDAIRPDLDGNAIMELLGIGPGPLVGRAYKHLLGAADGARAAQPGGCGRRSCDGGPRQNGVGRESCRCWALCTEQAHQVQPARPREEPRGPAVGRRGERGERHRRHVADVEHHVVEGEDPPERAVGALALHGGVRAQLHHLPGQPDHERRDEHDRQAEEHPQQELRDAGDGQRHPDRPRPPEAVHQPRRDERGAQQPGRGDGQRLPDARQTRAQRADVGERIAVEQQREQRADAEREAVGGEARERGRDRRGWRPPRAPRRRTRAAPRRSCASARSARPGRGCGAGTRWRPPRRPAARARRSSVVSAEPASPAPTSIRRPIALTAPSAENPAPAVTARVLASTRCRFSSTTCGSATDSPASTNRLKPITASAPR